jgi:hypothetical protein
MFSLARDFKIFVPILIQYCKLQTKADKRGEKMKEL